MAPLYTRVQTAFNVMIDGLAAQGWQRSTETTKVTVNHVTSDVTRCRYRGENGRKCAVGQLIPDNVYDPEWDMYGGLPANLVLDEIETKSGVAVGGPRVTQMLYLAQRAHDEGTTPDLMKRNMRQVAAAFNLKLPVALKE